jgi:hypothetical protein
MPKTALLAVLALMTLPTVSALAAGVAVDRGSGPVATAGVTVLRGEPSRPKGSGAAEPEAVPAPTVIGGDKVWLVDGDRLVACRMVDTIMVGVRAVQCASRSNPVDR